MKATRYSEMSDQIYHPVRTQKTIICHDNLKLFNCLPAGTLHQAGKFQLNSGNKRGENM